MKKLITINVCEGKELLEGDRKILVVRDQEGKNRKIIMVRSRGQLFAFSAMCPHREPFDESGA
jgi:nitrite reductase/ring-hydroxylating ferredoxin subunit